MDHKDSRVEEQMSLSDRVNGKTWQDNGLCKVHRVQDKQDTGCFPQVQLKKLWPLQR